MTSASHQPNWPLPKLVLASCNQHISPHFCCRHNEHRYEPSIRCKSDLPSPSVPVPAARVTKPIASSHTSTASRQDFQFAADLPGHEAFEGKRQSQTPSSVKALSTASESAPVAAPKSAPASASEPGPMNAPQAAMQPAGHPTAALIPASGVSLHGHA